jgi:hypothetical protein
MHRATPANSSFRGYTAGGARSTVDKADDGKLMQEMAGGFMKNEARKAIESPQNYGFTSVVMDAEKDAMGKIISSAETFISFIGGNRSFPVAGNMDDRRHRLMGLEKGDTAMYRTKDDDQQFHMTTKGGFWSAPQGKTVRMQLVPQGSAKKGPPQGKGQQQGAAKAGVGTLAADGGGSSGSGGGQQQGQQNKPTGQKAVAEAGANSINYVEVKSDETNVSGNRSQLKLSDKKGYVDCSSDKQVWLGYPKGEADFGKVLTTKGPAKNVWGRVG